MHGEACQCHDLPTLLSKRRACQRWVSENLLPVEKATYIAVNCRKIDKSERYMHSVYQPIIAQLSRWLKPRLVDQERKQVVMKNLRLSSWSYVSNLGNQLRNGLFQFLWRGFWFREFCWWLAEYIAKVLQCIRPSCRDQSSIRLCGYTIIDIQGGIWRWTWAVVGDFKLVMAWFPTLWSACLNADKHPHLSIVLHTILICWRVTRKIVITCPNYNIFTISHLSNVARRLSTSISPHLQLIVPRRQDQTPSLSQVLRLHFLPPSLFDQEVRSTKNVQETSSWTF
jgi:hypothetical protein